jgi:hypothetical protein
MNNRQRRVREIELSLTPQQVVVLWLRKALQAGTFEESALQLPPHRGTIANAVHDTVRNSMKGQSELLVEPAILQARQEADQLYLLAVNVNTAVRESRAQREREYIFLLGYLSAEMHGNPTNERVQSLRSAILLFIEPVIILDVTIGHIVAMRFMGQPVLFPDSVVMLTEQLQMTTDLSEWFNSVAAQVGAAEVNLEDLRSRLQSGTDQKISIWLSLARMEMLSRFGKPEEVHAAIDRILSDHFKSGQRLSDRSPV